MMMMMMTTRLTRKSGCSIEMMFDGKDSFLLRAGKKEKDWKVEAKA